MNLLCRCVPIFLSLLCLSMVALLVTPVFVQSAPPLASSARMRPYSGIGVVLLAVSPESGAEPYETLQRYDEPGMVRRGELDISAIPRHEWIFGPGSATVPLVVMARKGAWLKVVYDDGGREAWINPGKRGVFQAWEQFFKGRDGRMLPGLQKRYYQLYRQPGSGQALASVSPRQVFKMILLDGGWAAVMPDPNTLNWLRWRDEDGRLLIGLERWIKQSKQP